MDRVAPNLVKTVLAVAALLLSLAATPIAEAAPAAIKKIENLNAKAIAAYEGGDSEAAKTLLLDAVVLGKANGLGEHVAVGRTYLNLGLIHIDGLKDAERGERYFTLALRIDPSIKMKSGMANDDVVRAFEKARTLAAAEQARQAETASDTEAQLAEQAAQSAGAEKEKRSKAAAAAQEKADREEQDKILRELASTREREAKDKEKAALLAAQEKREREQKAKEEQDKILRDLAAAREREAKETAQREREEKERLRQELAQAAARDKERAAKEAQERAQMGKWKADVEKDLAATREREKAERAAKEQLAKDKQALEKLLAAEKERLEKEMKELAKKLAEAEAREKKERAAKEDLQEEKRLTVLRETDARRLAQQQKEQREKEAATRAALAEGPALPANIPERLHCSTPDEAPPETDFFVHCVPQGSVKADEITLFYRPSGSSRFNTMAMERSRKGWYTAVVPGALVKGRMLQYYVEAGNARGKAAASNGKASSPNVVMINRWPKVADATTTSAPATARAGRKPRVRTR